MIRQPIAAGQVAPLLAALVISAGLAPPLLDAREPPAGHHVESEHDPATCAVLHNHTACSQLAKWWGGVSWARTLFHRPDRVPRATRPPYQPIRPLRTFSLQPSPRGPPALLS